LEIGLFIGRGNPLGEPIALEHAEEHVFGLALFYDWSGSPGLLDGRHGSESSICAGARSKQRSPPPQHPEILPQNCGPPQDRTYVFAAPAQCAENSSGVLRAEVTQVLEVDAALLEHGYAALEYATGVDANLQRSSDICIASREVGVLAKCGDLRTNIPAKSLLEMSDEATVEVGARRWGSVALLAALLLLVREHHRLLLPSRVREWRVRVGHLIFLIES
jgi:hypothetical protein